MKQGNVSKKIKQVSFFSAIIVTIGATIGAGIFVKNSSLLALTQGRIPFIITAWVIAGFSLICLGVSLFELSSVAKGNKGVLEWTKAFLPRWLHKGSVGYIGLFYYPANIFALSVFFVQQIMETGNFVLPGWLVGVIAMLTALWTLGITGFSLSIGEKVQWLTTFAKFVPLFALPIVAYFKHDGPASIDPHSFANGFAGYSPWIGIFGTIPAIAFAFDGFYRATDLRKNMKHPGQATNAMMISIVFVVASYLFFSTSFLFATKSGTYAGMSIGQWKEVFRALICVSVFGIINGYAIAAPNVIQALWHDSDFWHPKVLQKFKRDRHASAIFVMAIVAIFFAVLIPIGTLGYQPTAYNSGVYGESAAGLFALNDVFSNWASMVIFLVIAFSVIGGLMNRKTKKIEVKKYKHFVWTAIIGVAYILLGFFFMITEQISNITGFNGADYRTAIYTLVILALSLVLSFTPLLIEFIKKRLKKSNSHIGLIQSKE